MPEHKSGFVAIVGRPNVGKSTLLNRIVGQKIAIMSDKAQTTRNKIQGVYTTPEAQLIFIDTPGIHKPKHRLGDFMVEAAYSALKEVDAVLFMISADQKRGRGDDFIIERLKNVHSPVYLIINKIDKIHPDELLGIIEDYSTQMPFAQVIPISATEGNNVERLMDVLVSEMPEGPQYFPDDQVTDHPEYFIVSELIREKVLFLTRDEVPHSVAVVVDSMKRNENDKIHIHYRQRRKNAEASRNESEKRYRKSFRRQSLSRTLGQSSKRLARQKSLSARLRLPKRRILIF